jgi:energy-coupling factor transporter ATP-binding protein EcfA2
LVEDGANRPRTIAAPEFPPEPSSIGETGLSRALLTRLVVKAVYVMGELTEASLGQELKLPYAVMKEILTSLCKEKYCEIKGPGDGVGIVFRYVLTDLGLMRAQEYMDTSQYVGPAPVTLAQFRAMVQRQSALKWPFTRPTLEGALGHLVLTRHVCDQLGGAVNSGAPIFLYGDSGNGKTAIAEAIGGMLSGEGGGETRLPYAIEVDEQIIEVYDPAIHVAVETPDVDGDASVRTGLKQRYDTRWILCRRPTVFTGGELTLPMLDLCFNPISKYYAAPPQVKASGGVFIIDDFGRQQVPPQALLNRWIVPLEKRVDYLTLHTGKKFQIPFDTLVVICTNIEPQKLADEAFLRRMRNKIHVGDPSAEEYQEIFRRYCERYGMRFEARAVDYLQQRYYSNYRITPRSCHPRDLIEQIMSIAKFYDIPPSLEPWFLDRACQNYLLLDPGRPGE